jgi:hypothetical protein
MIDIEHTCGVLYIQRIREYIAVDSESIRAKPYEFYHTDEERYDLRNVGHKEWGESSVNRLKTLWDQKLSTAQIGRVMGISKNAVVGKARRLGLEPRPSPIKRDGKSEPKRPYKARRLPYGYPGSIIEEFSSNEIDGTRRKSEVLHVRDERQAPLPLIDLMLRNVMVARARKSDVPDMKCQWLEGDQRSEGGRGYWTEEDFCNDPVAKQGTCWCQKHREKVFEKGRRREKEEEAEAA